MVMKLSLLGSPTKHIKLLVCAIFWNDITCQLPTLFQNSLEFYFDSLIPGEINAIWQSRFVIYFGCLFHFAKCFNLNEKKKNLSQYYPLRLLLFSTMLYLQHNLLQKVLIHYLILVLI